MTARKYLTLIAMFLLPVLVALGQEDRGQRFERIEAEKVAFITRELKLTPAEAQRFFPIYNQYYKAISKLMQDKRRVKLRGQQENQKLPGKGFNPGGSKQDVLDFDALELELKRTYRDHFAKVIGQARASRFFAAEEEFRNYLLRELQERRARGDR